MRGGLVVCIVLSLVERPARGEPVDPARTIYAEAERAYRQGRYADAARQYEEAFRLRRMPAILADIAKSYGGWYEKSGDLEHLKKAVDFYRAFLREAPHNAPLRSAAEKLLPGLEKTLAAQLEQQKQAQEAARQAYVAAARHYDLGEWRQALEAFKLAYLKFESPAFLYNIAQCHRQLGEKSEALRFYQTYVRMSPGGADQAEVETIITALKKQIEEESRAAPSIGAPPPEAAPRPEITVARPPARGRRPLKIAGAVLGGVGVAALATGIAVSVLSRQAADELTQLGRDRLPFDPAKEAEGERNQVLGGVFIAVGGAVVVGGVALLGAGFRR
jgi:tetratricopeptide (TPR) repeat protein